MTQQKTSFLHHKNRFHHNDAVQDRYSSVMYPVCCHETKSPTVVYDLSDRNPPRPRLWIPAGAGQVEGSWDFPAVCWMVDVCMVL